MEEILDLYNFALNFESFCEKTEGNGLNKEIFSVKFKILFFIYKYRQTSPSNLVDFLNMAKSNVALFCKQLLQEQLIVSRIDELDHRLIYYCLTKKGEKYIEKQFMEVDNYFKKCFNKNEIKDMHNSIKKVNKIFLKQGNN